MDEGPGRDDLAAVCSLDDANRRALYGYVASQAGPVTRDEAAAGVGLDRAAAAYHLDKLVEEGLLSATFARPPGRSGPGAGRPAKRYERSGMEFGVSVPARDYELAAEIMARAAEASTAARTAVIEAARAAGAEVAADREADEGLLTHLRRTGFEPYDDDGIVRLRNCPFHRIAQRHTEVVCGMNLAFLGALAAALDAGVVARLDPAPDRCCVALVPGDADAAAGPAPA